MISMVLNRYRMDFSGEQRALIDLLRPHIGQAAAIAALLDQPVPDIPLDADGRPLLTPRQTRILQLVAAGSSDRAVARALKLSVRTVLQHIYRALGVTSRTEALAHVRALSVGGTGGRPLTESISGG
jgi:DNA-binding CsgD family transcriptional regulator